MTYKIVVTTRKDSRGSGGNASSGQIGSHGCIAILTEIGTDKVWNQLKSIQKQGFDSINVIVKYPQKYLSYPTPEMYRGPIYPIGFGF